MFVCAILALQVPAATLVSMELLLTLAMLHVTGRKRVLAAGVALQRAHASALTGAMELHVKNVRLEPGGKGARRFASRAAPAVAMAAAQVRGNVSAGRILMVIIVRHAFRDITDQIVIFCVTQGKRAAIVVDARQRARVNVTRISMAMIAHHAAVAYSVRSVSNHVRIAAGMVAVCLMASVNASAALRAPAVVGARPICLEWIATIRVSMLSIAVATANAERQDNVSVQRATLVRHVTSASEM